MPDWAAPDDSPAPWHGIEEIIATAVASVDSTAANLSEALEEPATPGIPEIPMTAAMAPDTGSHASIQINTTLRREFMGM